MKTTITLTHDYTAWVKRTLRRERSGRYTSALKNPAAMNALIQEYVRAVLLEHRASWDGLGEA